LPDLLLERRGGGEEMKTRKKNHHHFCFYSIGSTSADDLPFLCTNFLVVTRRSVDSIARHSEASMSKQIGSWPAEYSSTGSCDLVSNTTASAFERVRRRKIIESVFGSVFRGSNFVVLEQWSWGVGNRECCSESVRKGK
jgi:hypothetical protein